MNHLGRQPAEIGRRACHTVIISICKNCQCIRNFVGNSFLQSLHDTFLHRILKGFFNITKGDLCLIPVPSPRFQRFYPDSDSCPVKISFFTQTYFGIHRACRFLPADRLHSGKYRSETKSFPKKLLQNLYLQFSVKVCQNFTGSFRNSYMKKGILFRQYIQGIQKPVPVLFLCRLYIHTQHRLHQKSCPLTGRHAAEKIAAF